MLKNIIKIHNTLAWNRASTVNILLDGSILNMAVEKSTVSCEAASLSSYFQKKTQMNQ